MLPHRHDFEALGTFWSIASERPLPSNVLQTIHSEIDEFDRVYSRFRTDSLVSQIAKTKGTFDFPANAKRLFDFYKALYDQTSGKVTPLIGEMLERAGYDQSYSFKSRTQKALPSWDNSMRWQGTQLTTEQPIVLDVGAAGKGYLVDLVATILDAHNIQNYVIDASGDLKHRGISENRVGLEHPLKQEMIIGVINVRNESLAASAINRRKWGNNMHHIFDPELQAPTGEIIATWVITKDALTADGLATALFFVSPEKLSHLYNFQYVRMHADGHIDYSHDFKGELYQ